MGTLYLVGTPIGNLEDLTRRAARILGQVSLVAAEDTRVTRKLLAHLGLKTPLLSCHENNWPQRLPALLEALAAGDVALVTDAGVPAISDPGAAVAQRVAAAGFPVTVIPGPAAVTAALAAAGFPADSFLFLGFLPRQAAERRARLAQAAALPFTLVCYEAPHRVRETLAALLESLGDRECAVCRELTKLHEEVFRGTLAAALAHFTEPRGEFTIVAAGAKPAAAEAVPDRDALREQLARLRQQGARARDAVAQVAATSGLPKNEVYQLWLEGAAIKGQSQSSLIHNSEQL